MVREGIRVDRNARTEGDQEVVLTLGPPFDSDSDLHCFGDGHKCRYGRLFVRFLRPFLGEDCIDAKRAPLAFEPVGLLQFCLLAESETGQ